MNELVTKSTQVHVEGTYKNQTDRKVSNTLQTKGIKSSTPTRTEVMSTSTHLIENRPSEQISTEKMHNWLRNDRGP